MYVVAGPGISPASRKTEILRGGLLVEWHALGFRSICPLMSLQAAGQLTFRGQELVNTTDNSQISNVKNAKSLHHDKVQNNPKINKLKVLVGSENSRLFPIQRALFSIPVKIRSSTSTLKK